MAILEISGLPWDMISWTKGLTIVDVFGFSLLRKLNYVCTLSSPRCKGRRTTKNEQIMSQKRKVWGKIELTIFDAILIKLQRFALWWSQVKLWAFFVLFWLLVAKKTQYLLITITFHNINFRLTFSEIRSVWLASSVAWRDISWTRVHGKMARNSNWDTPFHTSQRKIKQKIRSTLY